MDNYITITFFSHKPTREILICKIYYVLLFLNDKTAHSVSKDLFGNEKKLWSVPYDTEYEE